MEFELESANQYMAIRSDESNPERMLYFSGLGTWTRSPAFALRGTLAAMTSIVQKIAPAYPGLKLEKAGDLAAPARGEIA